MKITFEKGNAKANIARAREYDKYFDLKMYGTLLLMIVSIVALFMDLKTPAGTSLFWILMAFSAILLSYMSHSLGYGKGRRDGAK